MNLPKILVGCPTSFHKEYALKQYVEALKSLTYPNFDILLVDNSPDDSYLKKIQSYGLNVIKGPYFESARDRIIASRNILRQKVLDENYDYLFSLEQDVLPPPDVIEQLLFTKKRIVSGIYFNYVTKDNKTKLLPTLWTKIDQTYRYVLPPSKLNKGIIQIAMSGLGCILIHKSIFNKIAFRYDKSYPGFDDVYFALDCKTYNFKIYADTNLACKHLVKNRPLDWKEIKS